MGSRRSLQASTTCRQTSFPYLSPSSKGEGSNIRLRVVLRPVFLTYDLHLRLLELLLQGELAARNAADLRDELLLPEDVVLHQRVQRDLLRGGVLPLDLLLDLRVVTVPAKENQDLQTKPRFMAGFPSSMMQGMWPFTSSI